MHLYCSDLQTNYYPIHVLYHRHHLFSFDFGGPIPRDDDETSSVITMTFQIHSKFFSQGKHVYFIEDMTW